MSPGDATPAHTGTDGGAEFRGPVGFMVRNDIVVSIVMLFLAIGGLIAFFRLPQEVLPEASLSRIQVLVPYPGATPADIEESVVRRIEEQIKGVEGVERVTATASAGVGSVVAEVRPGIDISRALAEIRSAVDRIPSFPATAERPQVREITTRQAVMRLLVYGDVPERALKELAHRLEEGISQLPEVSLARTSGARPYEISVEVPQARLSAMGLTLGDVARSVREGSLDLSAGAIAEGDEELLVRILGQSRVQQEFEDIILVTGVDGTLVRLGDVATVRDGFADSDLSVRYNGATAVRIDVFRTGDEHLLDIAAAVEAYVREVTPHLPAGVSVATWNDDSLEVRGRLGLLVKNAIIGLALVFLALALFLEVRTAGWVAAGLAVSCLGTFMVMDALDVSINMFSLVGFILALGIVVDDAIVVGESVWSEREKGLHARVAAVRGTRRVATPVIFSVLTTMVAFRAVLDVPGTRGVLARGIPIVVITVLLVSLLESLLLLPNHLAHGSPSGARGSDKGILARAGRLLGFLRALVDAGLKRFSAGPLDRMLRFAATRPFMVLVGAMGLITLAGALVPAGIVRYTFDTPLEGDVVSANVEMPVGTTGERTAAVAARLEAAGRRAVDRFDTGRLAGHEPLEVGVAVTVGELATLLNPLAGDAFQVASGHLGSVQFKLLDWRERDIAAAEFLQAWRSEIGDLPEVESLTLTASMVGSDLPIHFDLSHPDPERVITIAEELGDRLAAIDGVFSIRNNEMAGARELQLELTPLARSLHLKVDQFAGQVRSALFGLEALRVQRGREDVPVYVRLPEEERESVEDVADYRVRVPGGGDVWLEQIASVRFSNSHAAIHRMDGRRAIMVTADVDMVNTTASEVNRRLEREFLAPLAARESGFSYALGGLPKQQDEVNAALARSFLVALLIMYLLMAIPFGSWTQPLIVLAAVPLGFVGVIAGHWLLGLDMGLWSQMGLVGASGVVINDSLMMIRFINEERKKQSDPMEAIIVGSKARFRAIVLTSITTFLGVAPLVFETSTYATHLVPLAAALGFGVLIATMLLMLVIPALIAIQDQVGARMARRG